MGHAARTLRAGVIGSLTATVVVLLAALVLAAPASAKHCTKNIAPPGHAGSTQYYETVPTSCGNASPPGSSGTSGSGSGITHLGHGRAGVHALSQLGANGKAAASLAAATAPPASSSSRGGTSKPGSGSSLLGTGKAAADGSGLPWNGSAAGALGSALTGSNGGLGILLPIFMGLALAAAIAASVVRLRRSPSPPV